VVCTALSATTIMAPSWSPSTQIAPCMARTNSRAIYRPSPKPRVVVAGVPSRMPLVRAGGNGQFAVYLKKKNPTPVDPRLDDKRLPAPIQLSPPDQQVFDVFPRNIRLEWNPVAGAVSYGLEVEACWNRSGEAIKHLPDDGECINPFPYEEKWGLHDLSYELLFKGAQPGRWRVWAIDKDHKPGIKSPWRGFSYLPRVLFKLPPDRR